MSSIRVWIGPDGKCSEEFLGIDKIHFIKQAILFGCRNCYYDEEDWCEIIKGLEIDAFEIAVSEPQPLLRDVSSFDFVRSLALVFG